MRRRGGGKQDRQYKIDDIDKIDAARCDEVAARVRALNPVVKVAFADPGHVPLKEVLGTALFDMERASHMPGWVRELEVRHTPETEAYGIDRFVLRSREPLHAWRFSTVRHLPLPGLLRAKGCVWLASRPDGVVNCSRAGNNAMQEPVGRRWAAAPRSRWPAPGTTERQVIEARRKQPHGDRLIVETTGPADPAPVAQTFFEDDDIGQQYLLDAIVTMVDAKYAPRPLDEHHEAQEPVGFADRILIARTDIVQSCDAAHLRQRLVQMNLRSKMGRASHGQASIDGLLDIRGFNHKAILDIEPDFLTDVEHEHDDVTSCMFGEGRPLNLNRIEEFLGAVV